MNSGGYLPSCKAAREISTTFTNNEVNNNNNNNNKNNNYCFSIYHTSLKKKIVPKTTLSVTIN